MFIRDLKDCKVFIGGDKTILRELLHPEKANLKLGYSLAHATLNPWQMSSPHRLRTSEVYYILEGEGIMHIGDEAATVHARQAIYIPPNSNQFIENRGSQDLKFLCIVDPAWRPEDEEVL